MSVFRWAYDPKKCDGDRCSGDCDNCPKAEQEEENEREENKMETRKCKVLVGRSLVEDEENPCLVRDGEPIYEDAVFHCWTQRAELTDASPGVFVATKGIVEYVDTGCVAVVNPERITFEKKVNYDKKPDGWQDL